jgi:L-lactate dehydrogenase complex protein LldG
MNRPDSREEILTAIRRSLGPPVNVQSSAEQEYGKLARSYLSQPEYERQPAWELFRERLREYDVVVTMCREPEIRVKVAEAFDARGLHRIACPKGVPAAWLPAGPEYLPGEIMGCTVAIAETGTIVLQHGEQAGPRRLTLLPDFHLCVVLPGQLVHSVPQAFARLAPVSTSPLTLISGPSATADIEMTRIRGVHGPRNLEVICVTNSFEEDPSSAVPRT